MVLFNYSTRELTAKVVYYGPGLCGKTTNLQYIFDHLPGSVKGKMLSLATKTDRTLFFDFLPLDLGEIRGMKTRIQLYTVPGQVFYNETRRLVLKGADGVVFVADSQRQMLEANVDSYRNLEENLRVHSMKLGDVPLVLQYNKRDLPNLLSIEDLNAAVNKYNSPFYESVATTGIGVQDTLKAITKLVLLHLTRKYDAKQKATDAAATTTVAVSAGAARPATTTVAVSSSFSAATPTAEAARAAGRVSEAASAPVVASVPAPISAPVSAIDDAVDSGEDVVELTDEIDEPVAASASAGASLEAGIEPEPVELTDEVDEPVTASAASATMEREFEIDHSLEDEAGHSTPAHAETTAALPKAGPGEATPVTAGAAPGTPGSAHDRTPGEVLQIAVGEPRELVMPVELVTSTGIRRMKLSVRIALLDIPPGE